MPCFEKTLPGLKSIFLLLLLMAFLMSSSVLASVPNPDEATVKAFLRPDLIPQPNHNRVTPERIELGKKLFFDPRLSGSNWISCASCHNPALAWQDGLKKPLGHNFKQLHRTTPTILNIVYLNRQFWDGRAVTMQEQALGPIENKDEMNQDLDELVKELKAIPGYVKLFNEAYPKDGVSKEAIAKAISSFERTIVSTDSEFDRWLKGAETKMTESAKRGFKLFTGKARCSICHSGFNFSDKGFHNIGLPGNTDEGRYAIKPVKVMKGAFKTPTLRDIALTAPYMHNGAFSTLTEVIEHYNSGGTKNLGNLDPNMQPLNLTKKEKAELLGFLLSLTGDAKEFVVPVLPVKPVNH